MGVDFAGYSNIITYPVPNKYKAKHNKRNIPINLSPFSMVDNGIGVIDGKLFIPDIVDVSDVSQTWLENLENDPKFCGIDWQNNVYYMESDETECATAGRSYSGYNEFIEKCRTYLNEKLIYVLPSTDSAPENGCATNTYNLKILLGQLHEIKEQMSSDKDHSWFYEQYYEVVKLGATSGVVIIA